MLRDTYGRTQLDIELDANLGIGYLQRVESGKVRYPERNTLERILAALNAHYTERRDILEMFGYVVDTPVPDEDEIQWAVEICQTELNDAVFPVYLLDCAHRLLTWNRFVPRLFREDKLTDNRAETKRVSMLKLLFDASYRFTALVANPEEFFPAQIRALRYEMKLFHAEGWYDALITELLSQCSLFDSYWTNSAVDPNNSSIAARPLVPLVLRLPDVGMLRFRLTSEPFAQDRRFRIIYYIPADPATMQQCIVWLQSNRR